MLVSPPQKASAMEGPPRARQAGSPRRSWLKRLVPAGLVGLGILGVAAVARLRPEAPAVAPVEAPTVNVSVQEVRRIPALADTLDLTGVIEPYCVVRVAAEVAGQIERYGRRERPVVVGERQIPAGAPIEEGQPVVAGEALVHLNRDLPQARYDRALAQFEFDEREVRRVAELFERGATSRTELDDARTRRELSKASLAEAARELDRTTIVAPIDGILNDWPKEVGEYVSPGDPVAEVVNVETVKVVVDVPERDVHRLKVGDRAEVLARVPEERALEGEITFISALADAGARTTRVEITRENRDGLLRSGQIVRARLTRGVLADVIMIPLDAVIPLEEGKIVYVVEGDLAQRRDVELGFIKGRSIRVERGLAAGDRLIVSGQRYVGSGQRVRVVEER